MKILLSNSRQNNIDCIFICHNSYFITRSLFAFIDVRIIKEVNEGHWSLERPHMKKAYENVNVFGKDKYFIDCDEVCGTYSFKKPSWFTEEFSMPYRVNAIPKDLYQEALDRSNENKVEEKTENTEKAEEKEKII
jgi:hypothetical protein